MRLLLDESVPKRLRRYLPGHEVRTVVEMGWGGVKNGALLAKASKDFDVFVTVDKSLPFQQNRVTLPIAVIVLRAVSNELPNLVPLMPKLEEALGRLKPGTCVQVGT
jgi:predicted nuclease of predicted toxin-antitoxin system